MNWIYLAIAAVFEVCWIYSLKFLTWSHLLKINFLKINETPKEYLFSLLAFLGYVSFGIANITFFSIATKTIPSSTAFAVWMGTTMILARIADTLFLKESVNAGQIIFLFLVVIGIIGLKVTSGK